MADARNPIVENKLTDENPTVKQNKYLVCWRMGRSSPV